MYYVGLDLGQKRDYSAVVVVERVDHRRAFQGTEFERLNVRYIERLPLGTPYPVVDMLRAARLGCEVVAVTITGGARETVVGKIGSVPKRDLLAGVEVLLEKGQLRIGRVREAARLGR